MGPHVVTRMEERMVLENLDKIEHTKALVMAAWGGGKGGGKDVKTRMEAAVG